MADKLDFSRNVADVKGASKVPVVEKNVGVEQTSTPNFQGAFQEFADANNSMSAIGARVAQASNNALAQQLGTESGRNPHGELGPSITEFDKNFAASYSAQANATLTIQADKLLSDARVQMSKPTRLTPELVAQTNAELAAGLNKIAQNAPSNVRPHLEASFASQLLSQNESYQNKMLGDQREDEKNNLINALDISTKQANELAIKGDAKGAERAVAAANEMAASGEANHYFTPQQARVARESTEQAAINGIYINQAMQADKEGKLPEFEKEFAANKHGLSNEKWMAAGQAVQQQMNFIRGLRQQDENLKAQQMMNLIATDPGSITATKWNDFADSVSQLKSEEVKFKYIQALKKNQSSTASVDGLIKDFSNPEAWANSTDKVQNAAFNKSVNYVMEQSKNLPNPVSHDQAEVQVAASAGGQVSVFTNALKNKLSSANPAYIESAAQQIHALQAMGAGHALSGLNEQDRTAYTKYEALRDSMEPTEAAREMTNVVYNQDPDVQQANKQKWSNLLSTATTGGKTATQFALSQVDLSASDFINPNMAQVYGANILSKFSTFFQLANGDVNVAKKLTKQFVDENFGETRVNGQRYKTLHPLEKVLGFEDAHSVPYIQQDVINQLNEKFTPIKDAYERKETNEYWETVPLSGKEKGVFRTLYEPVKLKRHIRTDKGEKTENFNVVLQGNAFDNWDVSVETGTGMRNLFQIAPYLGVINYTPNAKAIRESYLKAHPLK